MVELLGRELLVMAWLERSIDNHCGVTKYMRVAAEKLDLDSEFLPYTVVLAIYGPTSWSIVPYRVTIHLDDTHSIRPSNIVSWP